MSCTVDHNGRTTMKSSIEVTRSRRTRPSGEGSEAGRDDWSNWAVTIRRLRLDGLVVWFLDAGRPLSLIAAQLMYAASPLVGRGIERLGGILESDEESSAFARLLSPESSPNRTETVE